MSFRTTLALAILLAVTMSGLRAQDKPVAPGNAKATPTTAAIKGQPKQAQAPGTSTAKPTAPTAVAAKPAVQPKALAGQPVKPPETGAKPAAPPAVAAKPAVQSKAPAGQPVKPTATGAKPPAPPAVKSATNKAAAKKPAARKKPEETAVANPEVNLRVPRRDPFESLIGREQGGGAAAKNLPPGKAGLQVSTLRLDGVVRAPNGMIAVVSNPQQRTYFLREGDQLYDGRVEKITMDGVSFHEVGRDAFGKPVERQVNKRIYASAGEQQ